MTQPLQAPLNARCVSRHQPPLAVIATALSLEAQAVINHLFNLRQTTDQHGTVYDCGEFMSGTVCWRIAVAESGPGNHPASDMVHMAIAHFSPDILLFIGVAGGLKADVNLGDVIASTKVYGYHSGKSADEFHTRPELAFTAYPLEQQARAAIRQDICAERIRAVTVTGQKGRSPTARIRRDCCWRTFGFRRELSDICLSARTIPSDALAVEMEGYGALHAASRLGTPAMVVRGISDNVTNKSDCDGKGWRPIAAANASAFAFEVLAHLDISPFGRPRVTGTNFPPLGPVIDQGPSEASTYPTQVLEDELPGRDLKAGKLAAIWIANGTDRSEALSPALTLHHPVCCVATQVLLPGGGSMP